MKRVIICAVVLIFTLLPACEKTDADGQSSNLTSSQFNVTSTEYEAKYDASIVGDFEDIKPFLPNDYYVMDEYMLNYVEENADTNQYSNKIEKTIKKNYGSLETTEQVKIAAIEAFYYLFEDESASFDKVKIYRDKELNLWVACKIESWMVNPTVSVGGTHWVVFDDNGTLKNFWQDQ